MTRETEEEELMRRLERAVIWTHAAYQSATEREHHQIIVELSAALERLCRAKDMAEEAER